MDEQSVRLQMPPFRMPQPQIPRKENDLGEADEDARTYDGKEAKDVHRKSEEKEDERHAWNINKPFQHAPPKSDADPWSTLLEHLLKKDKIQCDAWKDEVQNLLIFAGLFSAVVTAFVIDSYKTLQSDPNDAIIGLLSHIATRLDGPLNTPNASVISVSDIPSLMPVTASSASVFVNSLWFLSLVLSLTTVLVGIISLQWLREHQSYSDLSPQKALAIFHMRSEGLEKWHVPKVFTALPLLLQAALVFFFAGLIKFLSAFSNRIFIPVTVLIALTLFFLLFTTFVPAFQAISLFFPSIYAGGTPPQCPYKSPQSRAFRLIFASMCSSGVKIFKVISPGRRFDDWAPHGIFAAWYERHWAEFDFKWLFIRDGYMQRIFYAEPQVQSHWEGEKDTFPLYDAVKVLQEVVEGNTVKYSDTWDPILSSAYRCFEEISTSAIDEFFNKHVEYRRNDYLHKLLEISTGYKGPFMQESIARPVPLPPDKKSSAYPLLVHDNLFHFVSFIVKHRGSRETVMHSVELRARMLAAFYSSIEIFPTDFWDRQLCPDSMDLPAKPIVCLIEEGCRDSVDFMKADFFWQYANVLQTFFISVQEKCREPLHVSKHTVNFLQESAEMTFYTCEYPPAVQNAFSEIFCFLTDSLENEMMISPQGRRLLTPSLLFYCASIYLQKLRPYRAWADATQRSSSTALFNSSLGNLLFAMQRYQKSFSGNTNVGLEEGFNRVGNLPAGYFWVFLDHREWMSGS